MELRIRLKTWIKTFNFGTKWNQNFSFIPKLRSKLLIYPEIWIKNSWNLSMNQVNMHFLEIFVHNRRFIVENYSKFRVSSGFNENSRWKMKKKSCQSLEKWGFRVKSSVDDDANSQEYCLCSVWLNDEMEKWEFFMNLPDYHYVMHLNDLCIWDGGVILIRSNI